MKFKLLYALILTGFLTGCITSRPSSDISNLQIRLAQLERRLEKKDNEIDLLKEQVAMLDRKAKNSESLETRGTSYESEMDESSGSATTISKNAVIIRVNVGSEKVQSALRSAGYYEGNIDGKIGPQSQKAIIDFQKDHDLIVDGIVGKKTWAALNSYLE